MITYPSESQFRAPSRESCTIHPEVRNLHTRNAENGPGLLPQA